MLKDRRVLLEQELVSAHKEAADMYLTIVVNNGDTRSPEYQTLKEKINSEHESIAQLLRNTNEFDNQNMMHL
jgi:cellobiose-specific phosphotransferase system component IIA